VNQLTEAIPFRWPLRIYYEDTDACGIVYYANYLKYFERARSEWLRHTGINQQELANQQQSMFVVKSAMIDYHIPAKLDDELIVTTHIEKLGQASLVFLQEIWRDKDCLVSGRFKLGCVHTHTVRPRAIPPSVRNGMQLK
jgi:acyl-CoA thioester hydrolase